MNVKFTLLGELCDGLLGFIGDRIEDAERYSGELRGSGVFVEALDDEFQCSVSEELLFEAIEVEIRFQEF